MLRYASPAAQVLPVTATKEPPQLPAIGDRSKEAVGARIQIVRMAARITQDNLARAVGVMPGSIYRMEAGKMFPAFPTAVAIARECGTTTDWLYDGSGGRERVLRDDSRPTILDRWLAASDLAKMMTGPELAVLEESVSYNKLAAASGEITFDDVSKKAREIVNSRHGAPSKLPTREKPPEPYDETPKVTKTKKR